MQCFLGGDKAHNDEMRQAQMNAQVCLSLAVKWKWPKPILPPTP